MADSFLSVSEDNIVITVIKKAEDSDALAIRAVETAGRKTNCLISLPKWKRTIKTAFIPFEKNNVRS